MLTATLSCRANMSNSGAAAVIAADAVGADVYLPTMATDEFMSCLSRAALETAAKAEGVAVAARLKDTRAKFVQHYEGTTYVHPAALFKLRPEDLKILEERDGCYVRGSGSYDDEGLGDEPGQSDDGLAGDTDDVDASGADNPDPTRLSDAA